MCHQADALHFSPLYLYYIVNLCSASLLGSAAIFRLAYDPLPFPPSTFYLPARESDVLPRTVSFFHRSIAYSHSSYSLYLYALADLFDSARRYTTLPAITTDGNKKGSQKMVYAHLAVEARFPQRRYVLPVRY